MWHCHQEMAGGHAMVWLSGLLCCSTILLVGYLVVV